MSKHTRGPWIWRANTITGQVILCTPDRGMLFVMGTTNEGKSKRSKKCLQPMFAVDRNEAEGMFSGFMVPAGELIKNPDHNGYGKIEHPDAHLIAAAPDLLLACEGALIALTLGKNVDQTQAIEYLKEAIAKAEGKT